MNDTLKERIEKTIGQSRVMLFMKGTPALPQCGFSAAVVSILKEIGAPFATYNILSDQELREGLKEYARWPTYPQLWVDGRLIGGCDIVREMHARGELAPVLQAGGAAPPDAQR